MKEEYIKPITQVDEYETTDIITASTVGVDDEGWIDKWY